MAHYRRFVVRAFRSARLLSCRAMGDVQVEPRRSIGIVAAVAAVAFLGWSLAVEVTIESGITPLLAPTVWCVIAAAVVWAARAHSVLVFAATVAAVVAVVNVAVVQHEVATERQQMREFLEQWPR